MNVNCLSALIADYRQSLTICSIFCYVVSITFLPVYMKRNLWIKSFIYTIDFFFQLPSYTSAQSSWLIFWFMYSLVSLMDRKNVHWMSLSWTIWMSSVRKNLSLYKMSYIACHSCICQVETILLEGICISWKNEINVLKLNISHLPCCQCIPSPLPVADPESLFNFFLTGRESEEALDLYRVSPTHSFQRIENKMGGKITYLT